MRELLFLTHRIPYPPNKGDKIRAWHMLDHLRQRYQVHLGCFIDDATDQQHIAHLQSRCASSCFIDLSRLGARWRSLRGLYAGEALSLPYYRDARLQRWVAQTLHLRPVSTALAYSGPMAQYLPDSVGGRPLRRVLDLVDVDSEKWAAYAGSLAWPAALLYRREARLLAAFETAMADQFDAVTLVSPAEAQLFQRQAPASVHKISSFGNGVDTAYFQPSPDCGRPYPAHYAVLAFTGAMDYWPNVDAVVWFAHGVLPALRARHPHLHFYIVGARPAPQVQSLSRLPGVHVTGSVPDVRPYLQHAAAAVAPLRIARGVQNKVLEAMAMQKVVVASQAALAGISVGIGSELLCADTEAEYFRCIDRLLCDGGNATMEGAARRRILADYDWPHHLAHLDTVLSGHSSCQEPAA